MAFVELRVSGPVLDRLHAPRPLSRNAARERPRPVAGARPSTSHSSRRPKSSSGASSFKRPPSGYDRPRPKPSRQPGQPGPYAQRPRSSAAGRHRQRLQKLEASRPRSAAPVAGGTGAAAAAAAEGEMPVSAAGAVLTDGPAFSFGTSEKACMQPLKESDTPGASDLREVPHKITPSVAFGTAPPNPLREHWYKAEHCAPGPGAYEGVERGRAASAGPRPQAFSMGTGPQRLISVEKEKTSRPSDELETTVTAFGRQNVAGKETRPAFSFGSARKLPPPQKPYSLGAPDVIEGGAFFSSFKGGVSARFGTTPVPKLWDASEHQTPGPQHYRSDNALTATSRFRKTGGAAWGPAIPKPRRVKGRVQVEGHFYRF